MTACIPAYGGKNHRPASSGMVKQQTAVILAALVCHFNLLLPFHSSLPGLFRAIQLNMRQAKRDTTALMPRYSFTPLECLLPTLFSQPTERAGTHAGAWKQEFPSARRGVRMASLFAYFARIIPDTRPSGSLRSRKIAPGDFFRYALLWCAAHSVTHLMCAPSFAPLRVSSLIRALRARCAREKSLPAIFSRLAYRKIYCAHPHRAYTRNRLFAYQPQVARRCQPPPMPFAYCRLPIRRHAVLRYGARSLTYLMYCSLPRALRALPDNEYPALTTVIPASGGN